MANIRGISGAALALSLLSFSTLALGYQDWRLNELSFSNGYFGSGFLRFSDNLSEIQDWRILITKGANSYSYSKSEIEGTPNYSGVHFNPNPGGDQNRVFLSFGGDGFSKPWLNLDVTRASDKNPWLIRGGEGFSSPNYFNGYSNLNASSPVVGARTPASFALYIGLESKGAAGATDMLHLQSSFSQSSRKFEYSKILSAWGQDTPGGSLGNYVSLASIREALANIKSRGMQAGDNLALFISSHGSSSKYTKNQQDSMGKGEESVLLGWDESGTRVRLTDNELTNILLSFDPSGAYRKQVFIDSCFSGGFWGSGDQYENGALGDLDRLSNVALFAASAEDAFSYEMSGGGGLFMAAIRKSVEDGSFFNLTPRDLDAHLTKEMKTIVIDSKSDLHVREGDFIFDGQAVPADQINTTSGLYIGAGFDPNIAVSSVAEPNSNLLLLAGLLLGGNMMRLGQHGKRTGLATKVRPRNIQLQRYCG